MSNFFGYYDLGLRALSAARLGLQVAGDNISNATTPGYARRRLELTSGWPMRVQGGMLDAGVEVARIRRGEDRFLQANLERETGGLGQSRERLRGLQQMESAFGTLDGEGILAAYGRFSDAFGALAARPEDAALRRGAIGAAEQLAAGIRSTYDRLEAQRREEDQAVGAAVQEVNRLGAELAELNRKIAIEEADGATTSPLRDRRGLVLEQLSELTGGTTAAAEGGRVTFSLPGGPTLVTAERAIPLTTSPGADGTLRIAGGDGRDITDGLRSGRLGALIGLRDDSLTARLRELDALAVDLIGRANAVTTSAIDLDGNPGLALFSPDPPPAAGAARTLSVSAAILADSRKLALSVSGAPGDGAGALELSALEHTSSAGLGARTPADFLSDALAGLGGEIVRADVDSGVSEELVATLEARRETVSGVSLDEEAVELIRYQRAFEAAARFMQVLNEVTEVAVNLH